MRHATLLLLALATSAAGCGGTPAPATTPAPQGQLEHGMHNCPSGLAGAVTRATNTDAGVDLAITATDPAVQRQIGELAELHEHMGDPDGSAMEHTGLHGGPGLIGHCPIVHAATAVSVARLADGALIHLRAIAPADVAALQAAVAERVAALPR
jgi:hypothetical protein